MRETNPQVGKKCAKRTHFNGVFGFVSRIFGKNWGRSFKFGVVLLLVMALLGAEAPWTMMPPAEAANVSNLEKKRRSNQQQLKRIKELKRQIMLKERYVTDNILQNQKRLETSRSSMVAQQQQLEVTKGQLKELEAALDIALAEQQRTAMQVGKRLRSLYMGEHMSFIHMFLDAGDISTLLDRMYYKKRILTQDKKLYATYIHKTQVLEEKKNELLTERNRLAATIQKIQSYRDQLQEAVVLDRLLVNKLKTSREAYEMAENQLERESSLIEQQIINLTRKGGAVLNSTGQFIRPLVAGITSGFGYRRHPIFKTSRFHSGIDFGARSGTPIHAADGGRIIQAGWQGGYGKVVIINHGSKSGRNLSTLYGHMSSVAVSIGQQVSKGQVIGYVGSTGYSTGPHLHFEVRDNGRPVNPLGFLR